MEEWDDEFFESLVKKRWDDTEGDQDSSACVAAAASIANNEKLTLTLFWSGVDKEP